MKKEEDLILPQLPPPVANFVPVRKSGNWAYVSGHAPVDSKGEICLIGKVGRDFTVADGYQAARLAALACLASLKSALGDLDKVKGIVKLVGFVNGTENFDQQPQVINGASDLLVEVFGERGRHARSAIGVASLPSNIPVEIEMVVEIEE